MKVFEFRPEKGYAKVKINNQLDLWHLQNIIEPNDLVTARTLRTIFIQREGRKEKGRRIFVVLTIKVEKVDFQKHTNRLRISGKIVKAPKDIQLGDYHTIEVNIGTVLNIEKSVWKAEHVERLEKAKTRMEIIKEPKILEEFFMHLNKDDGLATYGFEQVKLASTANAVKIALIPEEKIQDKEVEQLIKEIESKSGQIKLVSRKDEFGQRFCRMYDIGAILRFAIS